METKYFVDADGKYIGAFTGVEPPDGAVEVPVAPSDARQMWNNEAWGDIVQDIDLTAYAAAKRFEIETGGITVAGQSIDTSRESQSMITGAYTFSQAHPTEIVKFKAVSGWVSLDAPTLAAIATAVGEHVQKCFKIEEALDEAIASGAITTTSQIDAANWPNQ